MEKEKKYVNLVKEIDKLRKDHFEKKMVTVSFEDYDKAFEESMADKSGFIINENIDYNKYIDASSSEDIKNIVYENSIFSYKYGISLDDEEKVIDSLYQCGCGETRGIDQIDTICPRCRKPVTRTKPMRIGWLLLKESKIPHPFLLYMLYKEKSPIKRPTRGKPKKKQESLADKEVETKKEDIKKDDDLDLEDEEILEEEIAETETESKVSDKKKKKDEPEEKIKRDNLTLLEALNAKKLDYTWEDILNPLENKLELFINKYLKKKRDLIMMYKDILYTNKILVVSKNYRYMNVHELEVTNTNRINIHPLNVYYMNISACIANLNNNPMQNTKTWILDQKISLCNEVAKVTKVIFDDIASSKKAHIRAEVYGKKYTFSGRLVLESITDPTIHEVDVCQISIDYFRSTFVNDILKIGKELKIPVNRLHNIIDIDYAINEEDKHLIREVIFPRVQNPVVYTCREPSIYVTSILSLRVHSLIDEMILRVPFFILPAISGDFDGDVLANISWETPEMRDRIEKTLGVKRALIDTFDIAYNADIGPNNNTAVLLYKGFSKPMILKKKGA